MKKISRRFVLNSMGIQLILPLLNDLRPLTAMAASITNRRKYFIGVFFPNGTYVPANQPNGSWHWDNSDGVLYSLKQGADAVDKNIMILRNLFNGHPQRDPHWQNCSGFLSGNTIRIDVQNVNNTRCGKTIDQMIAEQKGTPLRSIEIGGPYYHEHNLADHPGYSHLYMNRISWRTNELALTPHSDPYSLYRYLFTNEQTGIRNLNYLLQKKKSVLDLVLGDVISLSAKTSSEGKKALDEYATGLREVERGLINSHMSPKCTLPTKPNLNYSDRNTNYIDRVQQFQKMLVFAMKCDLTHVGTIMYSPAVSGYINYGGDLGPGPDHHGVAHHQENSASIERLKEINRMHIGLLKHLLNLLKINNLIENTLVLYGTDMNNGNVHTTENIPSLLCGAGNDLKFGQSIDLPRTPYPSLLLSLLDAFGIQMTSMGEDAVQTSKNIHSFISI